MKLRALCIVSLAIAALNSPANADSAVDKGTKPPSGGAAGGPTSPTGPAGAGSTSATPHINSRAKLLTSGYRLRPRAETLPNKNVQVLGQHGAAHAQMKTPGRNHQIGLRHR